MRGIWNYTSGCWARRVKEENRKIKIRDGTNISRVGLINCMANIIVIVFRWENS